MRNSTEEGRGAGTLWIVPTPIGNLEDVTIRALRILGSCDLVAAEDTRRTRQLLDRHGIAVRQVALHRFNEEEAAGRILEVLRAGRDVACVTDSGTPGIADPGARLVARARGEGFSVIPVPGPCAPTTALSASGWEGPFSFEGWVERSPAARRRQIEEIGARDRASVLFESPQRIRATLETMASVIPGHGVLLAREMTKVHEEYLSGSPAVLLAGLPDEPRGEITLVVMPPAGGPSGRTTVEVSAATAAARELAALGVRLKDASRIVSALTGIRAREIYDGALAK